MCGTKLMKCPKCGGPMGEGQALQNTPQSSPDFIGDKPNEFLRGQTVTFTGPPRLISVMKCIECGHSTTRANEKEDKVIIQVSEDKGSEDK